MRRYIHPNMFCKPYKNQIISQQAKHFEVQFLELFRSINPSTILEIGTAHGGTALILNDLLIENNFNCEYYSYDIIKYKHYKYLLKRGIKAKIANVFTEDYSAITPEYVNEINEIIHRPGPCIILCDGSNKPLEFKLFSSLMKPGDCILAHDYAKTKKHFHLFIEERIWNWCDITFSDIEDAVKINNLEPFMETEFENIVWVCRRKPL